VRERAVISISELSGDAADELLRRALEHSDKVVRRHAALALGARGVADAAPALIDMIVEGVNDTDAADALGVLAGDPALADRIAARLVDRIARVAGDAPARRRLTQALADIPGTTASRALEELSHDGDRAVALTAIYLLRLRDA
jgi:HEAT repeat protein